MSSNSNHINISRDNYEEYLLLYIDNELTPEQKAAVDAFLLLHPDLQAELELLQSTVLPSETFTFNKEELFSEQMSMNSIDEQLLLYIDDELPIEEQSKVAHEIEENKTRAAQYALLLQTKLDKSEVVAYPNKEELYRRTERRYAEWLQMAAAVLILLLGGWLWLQPSKTTTLGTPGTVAANTQKKEVTPTNTNSTANITGGTKVSTIETKANNGEAVNTTNITNNAIASARKVINTIPENSTTQQEGKTETTNPTTEAVAMNLNRTNDVTIAANDLTQTTPQQIINTSLVTTSSVIRTIDNEPVTTEDNNSKGRSPLKGFLRKATRFIERTTGIPATNENNEVLIASVAVRLD